MPWIAPHSGLLQLARHLAWLCWLAYEPKTIQADLLTGRYTRLDILKNCLGFIAGNEQKIAVVLTGSKTAKDWSYNLDCAQVHGRGGRVHQGFAALLDKIEHPILTAVQQLRSNDQSLWVTGHSRGGALATLAACALHKAGHVQVQVCTFGAPRVGNPTFNRSYDVSHYRFENIGDPVPYLPVGDYVAVGTPVLLTKDRRAYLPDGTVMDSLVFASDTVQWAGNEEGAIPHSIQEYLSRLQGFDPR